MTNFNLNVLNYLGKTSLHLASMNGLQPMVELILDRGANIDQEDEDGEFILTIYPAYQKFVYKHNFTRFYMLHLAF